MIGEDLKAILEVILIFAGFAILHSLLTCRSVKTFAVRAVGTETVRGLYRLFYTFISFVTTTVAIYLLVLIPDRPLWKAPLWLAIPMHAVQAAGLLLGMAAFRKFDGLEFMGLRQAWLYLKGMPIEGDIEGISERDLITDGVYSIVRHPMYRAGILIFTFEPNITRNFLTVSILADLYFIYGALREDRLLAEKFTEFSRYKQEVPFMVPSLRRLLHKVSGSGSN
jgi:protein-S-isoprenylcysteine O-methyltransferase Ste14